ncbi:hypothetical protein ACSELD_005158 [Escherichia coli]|nr:hypothetical protein [Escherichia coli]
MSSRTRGTVRQIRALCDKPSNGHDDRSTGFSEDRSDSEKK